jgi:hypothetical protein
VQIIQVPTTTTAPGDALAFRLVLRTVPYGRRTTSSSKPGVTASAPTTCEGGALVTPQAKQTAREQVVVPDRAKSACYLLGPTLLTGHNIITADAVIDPTTAEWTVNLHFANDDFVAKVAGPYVGRQIAIVLNGVVESAPTINQGITGQDVTISGQYDEATAKRIASSLAPPSAHSSDTTTLDPRRALLETFSARCAKVAPRLGFGSLVTGTSDIRAADARAALKRASNAIPAVLATIDGQQLLALCEFRSTSTSVTPTSVCPDGSRVDVRPLILYAVDAHLNASRLPDVQYLFPQPSGATGNPLADPCRVSSP